jgi:hypothetical protein
LTIPAIHRHAERERLPARFPGEWRALSDALTKNRLILQRFRHSHLAGAKATEAFRAIDEVNDIARACLALAKTASGAPMPAEVTKLLGVANGDPPLQPAPAASPEEPQAEWTTGGGHRGRRTVSVYPKHAKTNPESTPAAPPVAAPVSTVSTTISHEIPPAKTSAPVPSNLYEGIQAYCGGKYGRAIELLGTAGPEDGYYRAQVALFRAASRFSQYTVDGSRDEKLRQAVLTDVREYRRLDPKHSPDARIFSPSFRNFVAGTAH